MTTETTEWGWRRLADGRVFTPHPDDEAETRTFLAYQEPGRYELVRRVTAAWEGVAAVTDLVRYRAAVEPDQVGFLVPRAVEHCPRCGDTNYREEDRVCLTCTYPDDPCSAAYLEGR